MTTRKRREGNPRRIRACVLLLFALLVPLAIVLVYFRSTILANDLNYSETDSYSRAENSGTPSPPFLDESHDHYIVEMGSHNPHLCVDNFDFDGTGILNALTIAENTTVFFNNDHRSQLSSSWQLCIAQHDHQHGFRFKTYQIAMGSNPSDVSKVDCDLYLSATVPNPSAKNWDWKSNDIGKDSITIYSYAEEFQKSNLRTLFISTHEKSDDSRLSGSRCVLQLEIFEIANRDLLHKLSLRGGQVLLPRDLDLLKKTRFS